jgi:Insertion element 4 transposase N-terminal/Transposase DDE domain
MAMSGKTPSVFDVDQSGEVLDRLVGLHQFISPQQVRQAVERSGRRNRSDCRLTHEIMLWVVLAMGLLTDLPIRAVFKHARRLRKGEQSPPRNSLCVARQRLGVAAIRRLFLDVVRPLANPAIPGAFYKGLRLVGVDGTVLDIPDTPDNARVFGKPQSGRAEGAFPQVRKLSLVELGTHAELAFVLKPCWCGETSMVAGLMRHLTPGMLLLWDRIFYSFKRWAALVNKGVDVLGRLKAGMVLKPSKELADGSYLAKVYGNGYDRQKDRNGIVVRVIEYTLDDPQRVGHGDKHVLISSLLDAGQYPALELAILYHQRWEEELTFDEQKTHQDPRRAGKPTHLRSETPLGVVQEVYALSLGHYVTRALMARAAASEGLDPDRLSFVGCLRILRCRLPECDSRTPQTWRQWYEALLWEMSRERVDGKKTATGPQRPNRVNPRVIKRKMSKFAKARPEHRHRPPLSKPFAQTIVMRM